MYEMLSPNLADCGDDFRFDQVVAAVLVSRDVLSHPEHTGYIPDRYSVILWLRCARLAFSRSFTELRIPSSSMSRCGTESLLS